MTKLPRLFLQVTNAPARLAATTLLGCALAAPAAAQIKCWTNSEGVRECGNTVPPEYAQFGHEVKSESGMTVETRAAAKTAEQVVAERERREAEAAARARAEEAAREQAALDRVLLDTFSSEDDLVLARDGRISNLESQVRVTESRIEKLDKSLDEMIRDAADRERRGKEVPEQLVTDIAAVRAQIDGHRAFIDAKREEQAAIHAEFEADLARFRELHGTALTQP